MLDSFTCEARHPRSRARLKGCVFGVLAVISLVMMIPFIGSHHVGPRLDCNWLRPTRFCVVNGPVELRGLPPVEIRFSDPRDRESERIRRKRIGRDHRYDFNMARRARMSRMFFDHVGGLLTASLGLVCALACLLLNFRHRPTLKVRVTPSVLYLEEETWQLERLTDVMEPCLLIQDGDWVPFLPDGYTVPDTLRESLLAAIGAAQGREDRSHALEQLEQLR